MGESRAVGCFAGTVSDAPPAGHFQEGSAGASHLHHLRPGVLLLHRQSGSPFHGQPGSPPVLHLTQTLWHVKDFMMSALHSFCYNEIQMFLVLIILSWFLIFLRRSRWVKMHQTSKPISVWVVMHLCIGFLVFIEQLHSSSLE